MKTLIFTILMCWGCFVVNAQPPSLTGDYIALCSWDLSTKHYVSRDGMVYFGFSPALNKTENEYPANEKRLVDFFKHMDQIAFDTIPPQNLDSLVHIGENLDELMVIEVKLISRYIRFRTLSQIPAIGV